MRSAMQLELSEHQPEVGNEFEEPTYLRRLTILPPVLPCTEILDIATRIEVNNLAKLPKCESTDSISSQRTPILLLSSRKSSKSREAVFQHLSSRFKIEYQSVNSLDSYNRETSQFMEAAKSQKASEALIIHEIDATANCEQPVIGGKIVPDSELYKPLHRRQDSEPIFKLHVFYLLCPTKVTEQCSDGTAGSFVHHASLCNSEFHSFVFKFGGVNWQDVQQALDGMETRGTEVTADNLAHQIVNCCSGLRSRRMSGIPSGESVAISCDKVDAPMVPEVEDALSLFQSLEIKQSSECTEPNSLPQTSLNQFISVVVGDYVIYSRDGFQKDKENFEEAAQLLGCPSENVHILCPDDGYVAADDIRDFITNTTEACKKDRTIPPRHVFLAVSAHGSESGIRTSDGKKVPLKELLAPLTSLGGFVLLFFQPCRGSRHHSSQTGENFACSLGFASPKTAGCVLPSQQDAKAAAIFASMAGYEAYRNETDGSWMPRALLDVLRRRGTPSVRQLAEMVQARLHELCKEGMVNCIGSGKSYEARIQIQYSANEGSENFIVETGLAGGATEASSMYQLNKRSQPDL